MDSNEMTQRVFQHLFPRTFWSLIYVLVFHFFLLLLWETKNCGGWIMPWTVEKWSRNPKLFWKLSEILHASIPKNPDFLGNIFVVLTDSPPGSQLAKCKHIPRSVVQMSRVPGCKCIRYFIRTIPGKSIPNLGNSGFFSVSRDCPEYSGNVPGFPGF